jgi:hypothetical protein
MIHRERRNWMAFQSVSVRTDRLLSGLYRYHGTVEGESQGAIRTETRKENTLGGAFIYCV